MSEQKDKGDEADGDDEFGANEDEEKEWLQRSVEAEEEEEERSQRSSW